MEKGKMAKELRVKDLDCGSGCGEQLMGKEQVGK